MSAEQKLIAIEEISEENAPAIYVRDAGKSRWGVTLELGIGNCKFARIIAEFDIDFPLQRNRG